MNKPEKTDAILTFQKDHHQEVLSGMTTILAFGAYDDGEDTSVKILFSGSLSKGLLTNLLLSLHKSLAERNVDAGRMLDMAIIDYMVRHE